MSYLIEFCFLAFFIVPSAPCTVPPSDKDVEVAFTLADADMSGLVDFDEFAKLYKLIKVSKREVLLKSLLTPL